jgi:hypothetical protein
VTAELIMAASMEMCRLNRACVPVCRVPEVLE